MSEQILNTIFRVGDTVKISPGWHHGVVEKIYVNDKGHVRVEGHCPRKKGQLASALFSGRGEPEFDDLRLVDCQESYHRLAELKARLAAAAETHKEPELQAEPAQHEEETTMPSTANATVASGHFYRLDDAVRVRPRKWAFGKVTEVREDGGIRVEYRMQGQAHSEIFTADQLKLKDKDEHERRQAAPQEPVNGLAHGVAIGRLAEAPQKKPSERWAEIVKPIDEPEPAATEPEAPRCHLEIHANGAFAEVLQLAEAMPAEQLANLISAFSGLLAGKLSAGKAELGARARRRQKQAEEQGPDRHYPLDDYVPADSNGHGSIEEIEGVAAAEPTKAESAAEPAELSPEQVEETIEIVRSGEWPAAQTDELPATLFEVTDEMVASWPAYTTIEFVAESDGGTTFRCWKLPDSRWAAPEHGPEPADDHCFASWLELIAGDECQEFSLTFPAPEPAPEAEELPAAETDKPAQAAPVEDERLPRLKDLTRQQLETLGEVAWSALVLQSPDVPEMSCRARFYPQAEETGQGKPSPKATWRRFALPECTVELMPRYSTEKLLERYGETRLTVPDGSTVETLLYWLAGLEEDSVDEEEAQPEGQALLSYSEAFKLLRAEAAAVDPDMPGPPVEVCECGCPKVQHAAAQIPGELPSHHGPCCVIGCDCERFRFESHAPGYGRTPQWDAYWKERRERECESAVPARQLALSVSKIGDLTPEEIESIPEAFELEFDDLELPRRWRVKVVTFSGEVLCKTHCQTTDEKKLRYSDPRANETVALGAAALIERFGSCVIKSMEGYYGSAYPPDPCPQLPEWMRPLLSETTLKKWDDAWELRAPDRAADAMPLLTRGCLWGSVTEEQLDLLLGGYAPLPKGDRYGYNQPKRPNATWTIYAGTTAWHCGDKSVAKVKQRRWLQNGGSEALTSAEFLERFSGEVARVESLAPVKIQPPAWAKPVIVNHGAQIKAAVPKAAAKKVTVAAKPAARKVAAKPAARR